MDTQIIWGKRGDSPILHNSDLTERSPLKLLIFSFAIPRGLWDLSSSTRDWTLAPCIRRQILNPWTTREVPETLNPQGCHLPTPSCRAIHSKYQLHDAKPLCICAHTLEIKVILTKLTVFSNWQIRQRLQFQLIMVYSHFLTQNFQSTALQLLDNCCTKWCTL